jgi:uncharacterized membrane protein
MERVIFIIALALLGIIGTFIALRPMTTIEIIIRFLLPGYHVVKNRKKAKKKVKKEIKKEEVFP